MSACEAKLRRLQARSPLYPGFLEYMRARSGKILMVRSLADRLEKLETLRHRYEFDLERPDLKSVALAEKAGVSAATLTGLRFIVRLWLQYRGMELTDEMLLRLKSRGGERRRRIYPKDLLTKEEREYIISHVHSAEIRAYLAALWDCGCRPSELATIRVKDVKEDQYGFVLQLQQTKFNPKPRPVRMLDPDSIAIFADYWSIHPSRSSLEAYVFINRYGNHLHVGTVGKWLAERFNPVFERGTGERKASLNLYLYRKSRITHLIKEKTLSDIEVKVRVGHTKHSTMLEEYYAILDAEDQAQAELRYLGVQTEGEEERAGVGLCPQCGAPNKIGALMCFRCRQPLSEAEAVRQQQELRTEALRSVLTDPESLRDLASALADELLRRRSPPEDPGQD